MKIITQYQCDICKQKYEDEEMAKECEAKGVFDGSLFPVGLMWERHHNGYIGIFAIPEPVMPSQGGYNGGHCGETSYWACRAANFNGDSLGEEQCGHDYVYANKEWFDNWLDYHFISDKKINCYEFKRMVTFLKSKGITPSYYNKDKKLIILK